MVQPAGHGELPRALGGGGPQQRRLHLAEALTVHGGPDGGVDPGPQAKVALHTGPAQVDVAVAQAHRLVGLVPVVDREGRWLGLVEDLDGAVADLDLAGVEAVVDRALGAAAHGAADGDDPFAAHLDAVVDHALDHPGVVPQVDEGQVLAVLAAPGHPAAQADGGPHIAGPEHAAEMGAQCRGRAGGRRSRSVGHAGARSVVRSVMRARPSARAPVPTVPVRRDMLGGVGAHLGHHVGPGHACAARLSSRSGPEGDSAVGQFLGRRRAGPPGRPSDRPSSVATSWSARRSRGRPAARPGAVRRSARRPRRRRSRRPRRRARDGASVGNTPSASQAISSRSIPIPNPMPGVGVAAQHLDQPVVAAAARRWRSGPRRWHRRRTRTWCGCSSRSRGPGGGRWRRAPRASSRPARTAAKCSAQGSQRWSMKWGASSVAARHSGVLQSRTRNGFSG